MLAVVSVLVVGFVPHIALGPTLPESLPVVALDPSRSDMAHRRAQRTAPAPWLDSALDRLADASALRDNALVALAAHDFADALVQAGADDRDVRARLREAQCDRFMARVERGADGGFVTVARRHGIAPVGRALTPRERAIARAWFSFRWEAFGSRRSLRGERDALEDILSRILPEDRVAFLSWVVEADCASIVGLADERLATRAQIDRCTSARRDFVAVAPAIVANYPRAEAMATIDALEGRALRAIAHRSTDELARGQLESAAREAFQRAHAKYTEIASQNSDRRVRRWLVGSLHAIQSSR